MSYELLKFVHIVVAIVALGASAGLGVLLEFFGDDRAHGAFLLRAIGALERFLVIPGYVLMALTGIWLASIGWSFSITWIQAALALWVVGLASLVGYLPILGRQIRLAEAGAQGGAAYRRLSLVGRVVGAAGGLTIVVMVYLMVTKPALAWWPLD